MPHALMRVVVQRAAVETPEMVVAALERAVIGQAAQMPLAEQRGAVSSRLQQRRQGRLGGRHPDILRRGGDRLLQPDRQAVLVSPGDQGRACGRTHGGVSVALHEADAIGRDPVDVRRRDIRAAVTGHVGIAEIIGQEEHDVRRHLRRLRVDAASGQDRSGRGAVQDRAPGRGQSGGHACRSLSLCIATRWFGLRAEEQQLYISSNYATHLQSQEQSPSSWLRTYRTRRLPAQ